MSSLLPILNILAPILLIMFAGALMRWKFKIDLGTLNKFNIYLFVPVFVFQHVAFSELSWSAMGGIVSITLLQVITLAIIVGGIGKLLRVNRKTLAAIALAVMFYNSGNYGLPLAELAFSKEGAAVQTFVMMSQNVLTYTVGLAIAAWAGTDNFWKGIVMLLRMPILPALGAGLLCKYFRNHGGELPTSIFKTTEYISNGLIPLALLTVGAQLASNPRWPRWRPVSMVIVLRLFFGPIQMALLLWALHRLAIWAGPSSFLSVMDLWHFTTTTAPTTSAPWPAQLLILTASVPTAITTLLLTLELDGDADLAADCVFWTTILSCVTIPIWLAILRANFIWPQ